jgi:hypothetical protein
LRPILIFTVNAHAPSRSEAVIDASSRRNDKVTPVRIVIGEVKQANPSQALNIRLISTEIEMVPGTAKICIGMDVIGLMKLEPSPFALKTEAPDRIRIDIGGYSEILNAPVPQVVTRYASTDPDGIASDIS